MAKDPAFLFYSQDFIVGVQTMQFEDRGKYITILCQMHQQGRLDEETIRFLVGNVSDKLRLKFKVDEKGLWYNERLELETERRNNFTESRRINGNLGGRPKKQKASAKPNGKPKQNHKANLMGDVNENEVVIELNNKSEAFRKSWDLWRQYRVEIKKPYRSILSEVAAIRRFKDISDTDAILMINESIAQQWQGIYKQKENGIGNKFKEPVRSTDAIIPQQKSFGIEKGF